MQKFENCFVHPSAVVIGNITMGSDCSIWPGAVLRADMNSITLGKAVNIQDNTTLHVDSHSPMSLGYYTLVGHNSMLHGCTIGKGRLIGIGAIVLNGVRVGAGSIVGAGALVTKDVPPRSLVVGVPAKVARPVSEAEAADLIKHAEKYHQLALAHAGDGENLGFG